VKGIELGDAVETTDRSLGRRLAPARDFSDFCFSWPQRRQSRRLLQVSA
jgi:hypothetical protein